MEFLKNNHLDIVTSMNEGSRGNLFHQQLPYILSIWITRRPWPDYCIFQHPKLRKSDQHSHVLPDITIFTFDLEIGPHGTLLGHIALLLETALLWKTYGLTTASLSLTILHPSLFRPMPCNRLALWQYFCIIYFFNTSTRSKMLLKWIHSDNLQTMDAFVKKSRIQQKSLGTQKGPLI